MAVRLTLLVAVLALLGVLAGASVASAQLPYPWREVEGAGFGDRGNRGVVQLESFRGRLYAGTERRPHAGPAQLWSSERGERGSWTRVTDIRPALPPSTRAISAFLSVPGGPAFMGTADRSGPAVYRSDDGVTWELATGPGSGWRPGRATAVTTLAAFRGALYVGTRRARGAQLWRTPLTGGRLGRVRDFGRPRPTADAITALRAFRGRLYAGTHRRRGQGRLWSSADGGPRSWRPLKVADPRRIASGNSTMGAALAEFRGWLLVSTRNEKFGAEIFSTRDGRRWRTEIVAGLDEPRNQEVHDFGEAFGNLWLSMLPGPAQAWRIDPNDPDPGPGFGFGLTNLDGFGRRTIRGGSPVVAGLGNAVFWGGQDVRRGAQVWRLDRAALEATDATGPGLEFAPGPLMLTRSGVVAVMVRCPQSDPLGCEAEVALKTRERFRLRGRRARILIGQKTIGMDSGTSRTVRFHVPRDEQRLLRRLGHVAVRASSAAFDNAQDTSAIFVLEA